MWLDELGLRRPLYCYHLALQLQGTLDHIIVYVVQREALGTVQREQAIVACTNMCAPTHICRTVPFKSHQTAETLSLRAMCVLSSSFSKQLYCNFSRPASLPGPSHTITRPASS